MIKWHSILFLLFTSFSAGSQAITISEELPLRNDYAYNILGWVRDDLLLFRDKGHEFFMQSFDEEMHLKWEREIIIDQGKTDIIGIIAHEDRIHLLVGIREKGDYYLQHRSYDQSITLVDTVTIGKVENIFITPRFLIGESEDKNKVVLFRESGNGIYLYSYDIRNLKVLWQSELEFPDGSLQRDYSSFEVNNHGEFFLTLEPDRFLQKVQQLELFTSVNGTGEILHETIDMGAFQIYDFYTQFDNINGHLLITGLYSDRMNSRAQGFYFVKYTPGLSHTTHLLPFDESLLAEVHGKEVSNPRGLSDFNVQKLALRQDGGVVIIAELNKEFSRRSTLPVRRDNGSFTRGGWVDYYYEDLILFAVHPDGKEHWKEVLRKRQYSQDDDAIYSSFFLFKTPGRLRFLFNDEIKQENTVGGYEVTGTGFVERKTVFNTDYQRLKLRFKDGIQVAYNECIVPSERNNRLNLVRIQY
ncbi:MAG: hypothetical protein ABIQ11_07215 [Saprospiraceae bacterium]